MKSVAVLFFVFFPLVLFWVNVTGQLKGSMHTAKNHGKTEH